MNRNTVQNVKKVKSVKQNLTKIKVARKRNVNVMVVVKIVILVLHHSQMQTMPLLAVVMIYRYLVKKVKRNVTVIVAVNHHRHQFHLCRPHQQVHQHRPIQVCQQLRKYAQHLI